ncbi:MAG: YSC84-related protein [Negativicutes bacterium]|nr:YSC84-related protein [Negativicutes bacterium]
MRLKTYGRILTVWVVLMVMAVSTASAASVEERRDAIRKASQQTLERLYNIHSTARNAIENAAGYAVFSISDVKIVFFGGGGGKGLAVNNATGQETFMKTGDIQIGLGLGIKKFDVVFVFESEKALADFANNGWQLGGQATAAATDSVSGGSLEGAVSAGPDMWMYQLTDKGLELSLTVRGIRYYKDSELN